MPQIVRSAIAIGSALALFATHAGAQAQFKTDGPGAPQFEAASVRTNVSGDAATGGVQTPGSFTMVNETLQRLIGEAYADGAQIPPFRIVGGPEWANSARFDVVARSSANASRDQQRLMLRALLADRFKLKLHRESRELPIYELVRARRDGQLGPELRPSTAVCGGTLPPNTPPACVMRFGRGTLAATGMTLSQLATLGLSRAVAREVVDRTGTTGLYDWTLRWAPQIQGDTGASASVPDLSDIFTAVQEQLGLKLEPSRGPVDVLVIDSAERPDPD